MTETKVIPKDVWKKFDEFWNDIEYSDLTEKKIIELLGKGNLFVKIPKNITDLKIADKWYEEIREFREKKNAFGGRIIDFSMDETPLNKIFPEPIGIGELQKVLWAYIKSKEK